MTDTRQPRACLIALLVLLLISAADAAPEAFEIGPGNVDQLPGGEEADGIIGDFVIRNDLIEAVVAGNQHNRKANMLVNWDSTTQGCLYDLTLRGQDNDQLTALRPGHQQGQLSRVSVIKDGGDGEAIIRAELNLTAGNGFARAHEYILVDGWQHLLIVSTYTNHTGKPVKVNVGPDIKGLVGGPTIDDIRTGTCQDPAYRVGYAVKPMQVKSAEPATGEVEIAPGTSRSYALAVAIGDGPAEAFFHLKNMFGEQRRCQGRVLDAAGNPATDIELIFPIGDQSLVAYVDEDGRFDLILPTMKFDVTLRSLGRADTAVTLIAGETFKLTVPVAAGAHVVVKDNHGKPLPCRVQFIGIDGTAMPFLGPHIRAHGCANEYHTERGAFFQPLPPGKYRIVITRGIEYDHAERTIEIKPETTTEVEATLTRIVDTTGWISSDFHNHTTKSGDNYCVTDSRIIDLVAEHIEFAPATEHNRVYPWMPHIEKLGVTEHLKSIPGIELTGGGPHLNAFPLIPVFHTQDNGAPQWDPDPRINALALHNMPGDRNARWIQLNHPDVARYFRHFRSDAKPGEGYPGLEGFINGAELWGEQFLNPSPKVQVEWKGKMHTRQNWPFYWMQMINAGHRIWAIAVSDAHEVTQGGVGGWRTYLPSSTDAPAEIDPNEVIAHAKAGHAYMTNGPFLQVHTVEGGHGPGETISATGEVALQVSVQCNTWVDIDRVVVYANGRPHPKADFRRDTHPDMFHKDVTRFDETIRVPLDGDAHLIVVAGAEDDALKLTTGYGLSWQKRMHPLAYHNPIFVDTDGDGFTPNGDMLDQEFLPE